MGWPRSAIAWKAQCCWFSSSQVMLLALHFPPLPFYSFQLSNSSLPQCLESSTSVPFGAFCVCWSDAVISLTILICNWTLQTWASLPSCSTNPSLLLTLGCQHNEGLISILPLISLFTALQVNADSKLQQAAVKHVINTASAANETLLLGLFREL